MLMSTEADILDSIEVDVSDIVDENKHSLIHVYKTFTNTRVQNYQDLHK